jgi:hypothetical protein
MSRIGGLFRTTLCCSFCGRSEHEVRKLLAGARGYICDDCVGACVAILQDPDSPGAPVPTPRSLFDRVRARWAALLGRTGNNHFVEVLR